MIPLQDVVATRQVPVATVSLIAINGAYFLANGAGPPQSGLTAPFAHVAVGPMLVGLLLLWLFGDNVEARLGRLTLVGLYLLGGWVSGVAAAGAITAVLGSYFVLLPRARVLTLVPFPPVLVEIPAAFFLGVWTVLHGVQFVTQPKTVWAFGVAFLLGAALGRLVRRPVRW